MFAGREFLIPEGDVPQAQTSLREGRFLCLFSYKFSKIKPLLTMLRACAAGFACPGFGAGLFTTESPWSTSPWMQRSWYA